MAPDPGASFERDAATRIRGAARRAARLRAVHKLLGDVHRATVLNYESIVAEGEADDLLPSGDRG
jgi:hypothetical protein